MAQRYFTYKTPTGWITFEAVGVIGSITPDNENGPFEVSEQEADAIKNAASIELSEDQTEIIITPDGGTI